MGIYRMAGFRGKVINEGPFAYLGLGGEYNVLALSD